MRLYLMNTATIGADIPVPCYLIRTDEGRNILIDTGYAPEVVAASQRPEHQGSRVGKYRPIVDRLADLGLGVTDIDTLIATHLDTDHAGMIDAFPHAEIIVQRAQYAAAFTAAQPRFAPDREHWGAPGLRYHQVDGDTALLPGVALIETSGHVPGHQSVLVRLSRTGPVLLAIDAINIAAQADPDNGPPGPYDVDAAGVRASVRKLRDLAAREGVALTVYGHDSAQWRTLKQAPEYYD
jgi:N-acyl homoserine lactone hydrolase